jgi:kynurenine formamidase
MHPAFEVLRYRSPAGLESDPGEGWLKGDSNSERMFFNSELVIACMHTGTHVDTLSHVTIGAEHRWYGGFTAAHDLGDFGPRHADASTLLPVFTRGILLDVAGALGVTALPKASRIGPAELEAAAANGGVSIEPGDVALIRTGYLGGWPDRAELVKHRDAGIDLEAAHWLAERGVIAVGADTEGVEQLPTCHPTNPQPVHSYLLVERGILLLELVYLEGLAADRVSSFLFIALPTKIKGATGAFIDPIAVV